MHIARQIFSTAVVVSWCSTRFLMVPHMLKCLKALGEMDGIQKPPLHFVVIKLQAFALCRCNFSNNKAYNRVSVEPSNIQIED